MSPTLREVLQNFRKIHKKIKTVSVKVTKIAQFSIYRNENKNSCLNPLINNFTSEKEVPVVSTTSKKIPSISILNRSKLEPPKRVSIMSYGSTQISQSIAEQPNVRRYTHFETPIIEEDLEMNTNREPNTKKIKKANIITKPPSEQSSLKRKKKKKS
mmetsp:Transcript_14570/g.14522  ORF Transcript_14570/g.14522 Transcript_14570/m.14522 type:complete len:157 (+) Transcript_14570:163-633(+)